MSKTSSRENWLTDVAQGEVIFIYPRGDLDWESGQAALDAQYGKGVYRCGVHGQAFRAGPVGTREYIGGRK